MLDVIINIIKGGVIDVSVVRLPDITEADEGKILMIKDGLPAWGKMPIKYVESVSSNSEDILSLRDLESGCYVLYGTFTPYAGSNRYVKFTSDLVVNVIKGTLSGVGTSHLQVFYPVNNVVQFLDITDESYTKTDVKLNELLTRVSTLESASGT